MPGLDHAIVGLGGDHTVVVALGIALLLGLRHATDPDHLATVSTLIATVPEGGVRRAANLGLAWGLGHAMTLLAFGLPVVLANTALPAPVQRSTAILVGILVTAFAVRLLLRWRHGRFHAHLHRHGGLAHRHLHAHDSGSSHSHTHEAALLLGRSRPQAFAVGLVHGMDGSAAVALLLLAGIPGREEAAAALVLFALATAASMAALSLAMGFVLGRAPVSRGALGITPGLGIATLAFGVWYLLGALP